MTSHRLLPWADMLRAASRAGVPPAAFWRLSLREWRWLAGPAEAGLAVNTLRALMVQYPDGDTKYG